MIWTKALVGRKWAVPVVAVLVVISLVTGAYFWGKEEQKNKEAVKDLREFKETKERIDEVKPVTDRDDAIEWLCRTGQLRDCDL